jgi:hypothetical protein
MPGLVMIFDDDTDLLEVCSIVLKSFSPKVILMDNWIPDAGGED